MEKFQRLQGNDWHLVKNSFRLLYTYKSDNGNIKGIYTDGKTKISHWLNDEEKFEQLQQENKKLNGAIQTYDILLKANVEENKQLKEKLDKYENPEDMTLYSMWCTEKVKDENKQLKDNWNELKEWIKVRDNIGLEKIWLEDIVYKIAELEKGRGQV